MADTAGVGDLQALLEQWIALEKLKKEIAVNVERGHMLPSFYERVDTIVIEMARVLTRQMRREGEAPGEPGGQQVPTTAGTAGRDVAPLLSGFSDRGSESPAGGPVGEMNFVAHGGLLVDGMFLNSQR